MRKLNDKTELGGIFGESVSVRKVNGRLIITNRPKRKRGKPTKKLLVQQQTFRAASSYAKNAAADADTRVLYAARIKGKHESPYTVALKDFMNPPTVNAIHTDTYRGTAGDLILVAATDDFMVTNVKITITDPQGKILEQGNATDDSNTRPFQWKYKTVNKNPVVKGSKIVAVAFDRPGNKGTAEITL